MTTNTSIVDDILDGCLDDIADLPSFAAWPSGAYMVTLKEGFKQKEINDKPAFELKMVCDEVVELSNVAEEELKPKVGDECSLSFGMDTETGRGFFKEAIKPITQHLGLDSKTPGAGRAAIDASKGMAVLVVLKRRRVVKDGEEKFYAGLVKLEVL